MCFSCILSNHCIVSSASYYVLFFISAKRKIIIKIWSHRKYHLIIQIYCALNFRLYLLLTCFVFSFIFWYLLPSLFVILSTDSCFGSNFFWYMIFSCTDHYHFFFLCENSLIVLVALESAKAQCCFSYCTCTVSGALLYVTVRITHRFLAFLFFCSLFNPRSNERVVFCVGKGPCVHVPFLRNDSDDGIHSIANSSLKGFFPLLP